MQRSACVHVCILTMLPTLLSRLEDKQTHLHAQVRKDRRERLVWACRGPRGRRDARVTQET